MNVTQTNFLDYLGIEERNLLASLVNFRSEFDLFYNIDAVYQTPLARLAVGEEEALVPQLFLFVHFHLYFAVSCILRSHLSDALSSVRKAIDGGLTAYELILEPSKAEAYVKRDKFFQFIKANVQNAITQDHTAYRKLPRI
jgi:hypothetical protein